MSNSAQQYIDLYTQCRTILATHSAGVLNELREEAYEQFVRQGLPTTKNELYRYINVEEAFAPDYGLNLNRIHIPIDPYEVFRCEVPNLDTSLYFMVNDQFYQQTRSQTALPDGVILCSLREAAINHPELVAHHYGKIAKSADDPIVALNTMLVQDGVFLYVPKGVVVNTTLQIVNVLRADVDLMVNRRILIVLEEHAEAHLLFCDHAVDDKNFLATQVMEVYAADNSRLDLYELEESHHKNNRFANLQIHQAANSCVTHNSITLHNGLTRNTTKVTLAGKNAETNLYGCVIADKQQHTDNHTIIDHQAESCKSNELYKYVLNDQAIGAFAGRILVREEAQKTVSHEVNANLCATKEARMYTQPMLEIYADDVKCNHGSTVGQLNEQALFYMQQRGISLEEARMLLQLAFACEVIDKMHLDPLKERLHQLVEKRFRGEINGCGACSLCK